jgi:hypothetical protein
MATKCFPGWRLGGTSPRFGHPPVPSRGGCPTTRRPQPRPGAPIWPAPSARFFAEPQPAINGGSARSCPACGGGGPRPDSGPPSAARGGEGGWRGHGSGWWVHAGRCDRSSPTAASASPHELDGCGRPRRSDRGGRPATAGTGTFDACWRRARAVTREPPHTPTPDRVYVHPIGCTPDRHLLLRSRHARPPFPRHVARRARRFRPATPPARSNVDGASTPQPATDNPGPGAAKQQNRGGEPVWQRRQGPVTRRSPRGDGCTWSITRIPTSRDAVRPSAVTADSRAAGGSKPPSC